METSAVSRWVLWHLTASSSGFPHLCRSLERRFDAAQRVVDPAGVPLAGRLAEVGVVVGGEERDVTAAEACDSPTQVRLQIKVGRVGIETLLKGVDLTDHTRDVPERKQRRHWTCESGLR